MSCHVMSCHVMYVCIYIHAISYDLTGHYFQSQPGKRARNQRLFPRQPEPDIEVHEEGQDDVATWRRRLGQWLSWPGRSQGTGHGY